MVWGHATEEASMGRTNPSGLVLFSTVLLATFLAAQPAWTQADDRSAGNRTVLGGGNRLLADGSMAISAGNYDEGIRLSLRGLEKEETNNQDRAAALSNICAAYAAKHVPDAAIRYCNESLAIDSRNWRAFSNRAYAYWLKGAYAEARFDVDAAAALSPKARQVAQIRGMLNEAGLTPTVTMEDHQ
jgi:tetratricopeptide (TPR) repeat protein